MPKIHTTLEPEKELDVSEAEALDLERMGLLVKTAATTPEGVRRAAERQTAQAAAQTEES